MKRLSFILTAGLVVIGSAYADSVGGGPSQFNSFTSIAGGFASQTPISNGVQGNPYWNDRSDGAAQGNAGYFLTASGNFTGQTQYIDPSLATSQYLSATGAPNSAPANFSFVQEASLINVTLLYTNAGQNFGVAGTQIGIYNVADPTQRIALFGPGTTGGSLWNNSGGGVFNAGNGGSTPSVNGTTSFSNWGLYAITCQNSNTAGTSTPYGNYGGTGPNCATHFSNQGLNTARANGAVENGSNGLPLVHQHFALFNVSSTARTFFVAFEDSFGYNPVEAGGDYNDVIFRITTCNVGQTFDQSGLCQDGGPPPGGIPEPATFAIVGLGLVGLGAFRKFRK